MYGGPERGGVPQGPSDPLEAAQRPGAVCAEAEDFFSDGGDLLPQAMWLREKVGIMQTKEVGKPILVTVVRVAVSSNTWSA